VCIHTYILYIIHIYIFTSIYISMLVYLVCSVPRIYESWLFWNWAPSKRIPKQDLWADKSGVYRILNKHQLIRIIRICSLRFWS
jgi:hypothetical protein